MLSKDGGCMIQDLLGLYQDKEVNGGRRLDQSLTNLRAGEVHRHDHHHQNQ